MQNAPDVTARYSDTFKRIHVNGIFGGVREGGVEFVVYTDQSKFEKSLSTISPGNNKTYIEREIHAELFLNPMQMKSVHVWLGNKIKDYEKIFGTIPSPEEASSRANKGDKTGLE